MEVVVKVLFLQSFRTLIWDGPLMFYLLFCSLHVHNNEHFIFNQLVPFIC